MLLAASLISCSATPAPKEFDVHLYAIAAAVCCRFMCLSLLQGVGEKVWLQYEGVENIFGYVWHFLLQDILQFDMDTDQALSRIATANRTCSIWCVHTSLNAAIARVPTRNRWTASCGSVKAADPKPFHALYPTCHHRRHSHPELVLQGVADGQVQQPGQGGGLRQPGGGRL